MKKGTIFTLLCLTAIFLFPVASFAQILNGGFEQWTGNTPDNWLTDNALSLYTPITQSNSKHSGSYSVKGQVVDYQSIPISPILTAGAGGNGFSVSQKYLSLTGYYEFAPVGGDELVITVLMYNSSTLIGGGSLDIQNAAASFTSFALGIEYYDQILIPDNIMITVVIGNSGDIHLNTEFKLDDISLSMTPTSVETVNGTLPSSTMLNQNYPNPFNPSTIIGFSLPRSSEVSLTIYDVSGKVVDNLINRQDMAAGYHSIAWKPDMMLPSGVYFYSLEAGTFSQSKRMIFIK
jgi:hypothetical protein